MIISSMVIRPYQESMANNIARKVKEGLRKICCQLPTGGGKTIEFAYISSRYISKGDKNVLILVDRKELLIQTRRTLFNVYGINAQVIIAGMKYIPPARVYVGMIETVKTRVDKLENIGLVIIDEAHVATFHKIHEKFPTQIILGFTATPLCSNKRKPMKLYYEDIVCGIDIPELIAGGWLSQNITRAPKDVVDRNELKIKGGEFEDGLMALKFSKPKYIDNTINAYKKYSLGLKTMIFNVNIAHSKAVCKKFVDAGLNCKHIDGETEDKERDEIVSWFKSTPDAILCNVGLYTKGFDEETIETIIVNKATMSLSLWLQMCGRGSRSHDAKSAFTIIDMGGNAITHGDWNQARDWENIFFNPDEAKDGVAPVKDCPQCAAIIPARTMVCPHCGYEFPAKDAELETDLHDFVVVTKNIDVQGIINEQVHQKEYAPFFRIGKDLAISARNTIASMSDETALFIYSKYLELAKEWMKKVNVSRLDANKEKLRFNEWHKQKAKEHLFIELKQYFPKWQTDLTKQLQTSATTPV